MLWEAERLTDVCGRMEGRDSVPTLKHFRFAQTLGSHRRVLSKSMTWPSWILVRSPCPGETRLKEPRIEARWGRKEMSPCSSWLSKGTFPWGVSTQSGPALRKTRASCSKLVLISLLSCGPVCIPCTTEAQPIARRGWGNQESLPLNKLTGLGPSRRQAWYVSVRD